MTRESPSHATPTAPPPIPFRLSLGVTGHRELPDDPALHARVREAVTKARALVPQSPYTPVRLAITSPLAEGADRLVTCAVLDEPSAILNAVLPVPRDDYMQDFATARSQEAFDALLERAATVVTLSGTPTREFAYQAAGQYVLAHSDVLIAVWDGKPARGTGGTAEIVAAASAAGIPIFWIESSAPFTLHEDFHFPGGDAGTSRITDASPAPDPGQTSLARAYQSLDAFNRDRVSDTALAAAISREHAALTAAAHEAGLPDGAGEKCWSYLLPHYAKADLLAQRYQQRFSRFAVALFWLAAASVMVVAIQSQFAPTLHAAASLEIACLLAIVLITRLGRRDRLHERYLSYRFLAERVRARVFLALVGAAPFTASHGDHASEERSANAWVNAALAEIWRDCPAPLWRAEEAPVPALRQFIDRAWVRDQIAYQKRAGTRHAARHERVERWTYLFFALALIVAIMHVAGVGAEASDLAEASDAPVRVSWEGFLIILSLGLPAIFSALHGIDIQGEYERNAERAHRMAHLLAAAAHQVATATSLPALRTAAWQAESVLLEENRDWFVLMRFRDFEIHV